METIANAKTLSAGLVGPRCHSFVGHEEVVKPARARKSDFVAGIEHTCRVPQQFAGVVNGERLYEGLWAQAGPAHEQALEMGGAEAVPLSQQLQ